MVTLGMKTVMKLNPEIYTDINAPILFFPVRHHSPAAARLVRQLIIDRSPAAVLIEGPSDFNDRLDELLLPHQLPIAIYSYVHTADNLRRGAFYPFCIYSPEWQALQTARELGIPVKFIDLPWSARTTARTIENCYSDETLKRSDYIHALCEKLGVADFDALWDTLCEIDPALTLPQYLERCHQFCWHLRQTDVGISTSDLEREAFMVEQIQSARAVYSGQILVITGGFHSSALYAAMEDPRSIPQPPAQGFLPPTLAGSKEIVNKGIALTPYNYDRLDNLTGYNSGMPNPGFYHAVWTHRQTLPSPPTPLPILGEGSQKPSPPAPLSCLAFYVGEPDEREPLPNLGEGSQNRRIWRGEGDGISLVQEVYRNQIAATLLQQVVKSLRKQKQIASTADLIAVKTLAQGLSDLRGHAEIWRSDLIDGVIGGLVKEDMGQTGTHPFLAAVYQVFRGSDRGRLAPGTPLPPIVEDIHQRLQALDLFPTATKRSIDLDLTPDSQLKSPPERHKSALLHGLRLLQIQGIQRTDGTNFTTRNDLTKIWERWQLHWTPDFDSSSIEASIYGATVIEATIAKLQERANSIERNAETATLLLLDAALAGVDECLDLADKLVELIRQEANFLSLARSIHHLLYLYRYDEVLGTAKQAHIAELLAEAFQRGLWLLDSLGTPTGDEDLLLKGLGNLLEAYERSGQLLAPYRSQFIQILDRVSQDVRQLPSIRGGAIGALWILGETPMERILETLRYYAQPERLGDFLAGLFHIARETTQRDSNLVLSIDELLLAYSDDEFLEALPALRLAFSYFAPREKNNIANTLIRSTEAGELATADLLNIPLGADVAIEAIAFESRLFGLLDRYGIRGGSVG
jgi:hypothetical protein